MSKKSYQKRMSNETIIQNCPKCNSENIAEFRYGLYDRDEKLNRLIEERKVILGGCEISFDSPAFYCNECGREF